VVGRLLFAPFPERLLLGKDWAFNFGWQLYELDDVARMILDRGQENGHKEFGWGETESDPRKVALSNRKNK
jgi:hypothetical protein